MIVCNNLMRGEGGYLIASAFQYDNQFRNQFIVHYTALYNNVQKIPWAVLIIIRTYIFKNIFKANQHEDAD